jgi:hypothetical protein
MSTIKNIKELCLYVNLSRQQRARRHRRAHAADGFCSGLTEQEYMRMRVPGKKSYPKARKFTHNRMWSHNSKYSFEQLKIIAKK